MNSIKYRTLYPLSFACLLLFSTSHNLLAAGTASGIDITNQATINYDVGGVNQNDVTSNIVTFKVDAKVDLTVTGSANLNGTPGQVYALEFTVTNTGNETYDFNLAFEAGTEDFTVGDLAIHVDSNSNGTWDGVAIDLPGTTLDNLLADSSTKVWLVGTLPATATDNQSATYHLMATARLADGSAIPAQITDVAATKQYVYADGAGPHSGDSANDTNHSASLSFTAQTAALSITKSSTVIWDPINLAVNPLHIPGAIIEYTIQINNGTGAETASSIVITDVLNSNLSLPIDPVQQYAAGRSIQVTAPNLYAGNPTALTDINDADEATVSAQTVTITGIELLGGESATLKIRVEIK